MWKSLRFQQPRVGCCPLSWTKGLCCSLLAFDPQAKCEWGRDPSPAERSLILVPWNICMASTCGVGAEGCRLAHRAFQGCVHYLNALTAEVPTFYRGQKQVQNGMSGRWGEERLQPDGGLESFSVSYVFAFECPLSSRCIGT